MQRKLSGIMTVDFDATGQLLIFLLRQILKQNGNKIRLFIHFKKANDSLRMEILHNILIEFGIPMKLIKML